MMMSVALAIRCSVLQSDTLHFPDSDAASLAILNDSSIVYGKDGEGKSSSPQTVREVGHWFVRPDKVIRHVAVLETCSLSPPSQESQAYTVRSNS